MKNLLRSVFAVDPGDSLVLFGQNYHHLVESGLGFDQEEERVMWEVIQDFFRAHGHVPSVQTLRSHFTSIHETEVVDRLERVALIKPKTRGDFLAYLEDKAKDRRERLTLELLDQTRQIIATGVKSKDAKGKETKLLGSLDAIRYFLDRSHGLVAPTLGGTLSGNVVQDGESLLARYDRIKADPRHGVGQYCGIRDIDITINGAKRHELWIHAAFTGGLKCVAGDTEVWDLGSGSLRTVREIHESGDLPTVHGFDETTGRMRTAQVDAVAQQGVRDIYRVTSETGKNVRVSGNHPFLTPDGWVEAADLAEEAYVAVPAALPNAVESRFTDDEIVVLGYLLGDGTLKEDIGLSNGNPGVLVDFIRRLRRMGYREASGETEYATFPYYRIAYERETVVGIRVSRATGQSTRWVSPMRLLLDRLGLYGTDAATKFLPPEMWAIEDRQAWLFLAALWSTDGRVAVESPVGHRKPRPKLWIVLKSRALVVGISRLLERLGVPCAVRPVTVTYEGTPRQFWQAEITTNAGKRRFLENVDVRGKEVEVVECLSTLDDLPISEDWMPASALEKLPDNLRVPTRTGGWYYARYAKEKRRVNRDVFRKLAEASGSSDLMAMASSELRWERVCVERDGQEMTYDLSVPGLHNFVANGFVTHNSTYALHWAYIQAVYFGFSSCYFSLEMPYTQCRNLIYAMHSAHEDFAEVRAKLGITTLGIDYEKIRDGRLPPNEEQFFREYVVPDLNRNGTVPHKGQYSLDPADYGDIHIHVPDPDKSDFTINDLRSYAELLYSKTPFSSLFVDHAGLMAARQRYSSTTDKLNEVIRDLKRLAMSFNRGMGMAVVALFQISREGYRAAEKNGGRYNLTHLSYANECISRTTKILCDSGILNVEDVKPGMHVWSRSGWKPVLDFFNQGVRPVWRVTNNRGEQIEATANHRLRVIRDETVQWCRVDALQEGDWLVSIEGDYPWPEKAPLLPDSRCLSQRLTDSLAYLLGAWDGDGCYRDTKIAFTGNRAEKNVRKHIRSAFRETFGEDLLSYEFDSRPGSFDEESLFNYERTRWFEILAGPRGKKVPEVIFRAPRHLVAAYMRGLWDTDGWVNNQGVVGLKMKSESFLREVQILMTALGIDTMLEPNETTLEKTGKTYPGWTLRVRGTESRRRFQHEIGFSEAHKVKLLENTFVETPKDKRMYPVGHTFAAVASDHTPYAMITSGRLKKAHQNAVRKAKVDGVVSHGAISTVLRVMEEDGAMDARADILREVLSRRITRVIKVEADVREEQVYDLEVDGDHEFQTGPFLSHNCERSADVVTAAWLDDDLRKLDRVIFQCLKSRDQKPFDRVPVRVEFPSRRLMTNDDLSIEEIDERVRSAKEKRAGDTDERGRGRGNKKPAKKESDQLVPDLDS